MMEISVVLFNKPMCKVSLPYLYTLPAGLSPSRPKGSSTLAAQMATAVMSTSHCYLQNTIFNLSPWLNCLIDVIGKKKPNKPTGCRVFWRAFLFTLRFMVQFLLRQNPMQHCWINIYFRKTLWRRSDLVGNPSTPHRPHQHDTTLWYFWRHRILFFFSNPVCDCCVYWRFPIYFSLPGSPNNCNLHFEGLSHKCVCHTDTQLHFLWML